MVLKPLLILEDNLSIYPWFYIDKIYIYRMSKFRSFAITIRPKGGIQKDSSLEKALETWLYKWPYQLFSYEMEGVSRHLHAQIFSHDPKRRSDICNMLSRIQAKHDPDWSPASKRVLLNGIKVAYDDNYLLYILKDKDENPDRYIEVLPDQVGTI